MKSSNPPGILAQRAAGKRSLAVVLSCWVLAAGLSASPADRLEEILSSLKAAGEKLKTLRARFEQSSHDYILDLDEKSSGALYVKMPGNIRWEYDAPAQRVLLVKGDKVRLYNPTAHQVQEFKKGRMKAGGADLLIGFGKSNSEISRNYNVRLLEDRAETVVLELVPKPDSPASLFTAIELTIEKNRWIPVRSVFHEPNHDTTEIRFLEVAINARLPDGVFELDLPPGVEIIKH